MATLGPIRRLRGARAQLWPPPYQAEQRTKYRNLVRISAGNRARQPMAVDACGRSSDMRSGQQLELAATGDDLDGGLDDCIEVEDLGGKDGR